MIKLILFDLSDVCFSAEETPFIKKFAKRHKLPTRKFARDYRSLVERSERDEISGTEIWEKLMAQYGFKIDINQTIEEMMAGKKPLPTLNLIKHVKHHIKTAYLTNYNKVYWQAVENRFDLAENFDYGIVSHQVRARKPAAPGFMAILRHFHQRAHDVLFIDDSQKNVDAARRHGFQTIRFTTVKDLRNRLKNLDLLD